MNKMNKAEEYINSINSNIFFQEFTFSKNIFTVESNQLKEELELADNIVWIDDLLFIFQIKERNIEQATKDHKKWFENKILKIAVKQVKDTLKYLSGIPEIIIENERGYKLNIADAINSKINKIIVYNPNSSISEEKRFLKFYYSKKIGFIHLFHLEDYYWICKYLMTPSEINEYLDFREEIYIKHSQLLDKFPEQYVLAHFLTTGDSSEIRPEFIENLPKFKQDHTNIELHAILELFRENTILARNKDDYFYIVKEIAKLNRNEFKIFKERFFLLFKQCEEDELITPNRVAFPRTDCGFVFIAIPEKEGKHWKNAIKNFALAHKYDQKLEKCIGITASKISNMKGSHDIHWAYVRFRWVKDDEMERLLADNFPFRAVKPKMVNKYDFKG